MQGLRQCTLRQICKAILREEAIRKENLKKMKASGRREEMQPGKSKFRQEQSQEKCKTLKGLETNIQRRGRGCQVRWVPCVKGGRRTETGVQRRLV
jgi:hypothetical protein